MAWRGTWAAPNIGITAARCLRLNILTCENINLVASSFHAMMVGQDGSGPYQRQRAAAEQAAEHDLPAHLESRARPQADHLHLRWMLSRGVPAHLGLQEARTGGRIRVSIRRRHHVEAAVARRLALPRSRRGDGRSGTRWAAAQRDPAYQDKTCIQFVDVDVNVPDTLKRRQPLTFGSPDLRPPRRAGE